MQFSIIFLKGSLGTIVFSDADDDIIDCEVFVPRWVENAVGGSENPFITDQTGSTQQLLRTTLIQHHLPANDIKHIKNKALAAFDMLNHAKIFENRCLKTAPVLYLPWSTAHFSLISSHYSASRV